MCVSSVSMFGGGGIDPILAQRYAVLNEQLRRKRIEKQRGVDPLIGADHPRVETVEQPAMSLEELRKMYANPILQQIPIHVAYKILQQLCDSDESWYFPYRPVGWWRDKSKLYE